MSRITLAPNASGSGTLTVAAPNTNTDRTLTLPDATGTMNISGLANEVPAGSAGSPSIYSTGDLNTGVFFPAADTVAVTTAGAERMRINASGDVGIGTSSPLSKLDVNGGAANTYVRIVDTRATYPTYIGAEQGSTVFGRWGLGESMRIDSSGNVGIGTSSPSAGYRVHTSGVNPGIGIQTTVANGGVGGGWVDFLAQNGTVQGNIYFNQASGYLYFGTAASGASQTERMRIDASGNVMITNLAGAGSRTVTAGATGILAAASDSRLKQEVPTASIAGLAEIMQLRPVAYKWLDDIKKRGDDAAVELGFFADEAKDIIPSAAPMGNDGYYGFYDRAVIATLVKAVQEQQQMIQALQADIAALKGV